MELLEIKGLRDSGWDYDTKRLPIVEFEGKNFIMDATIFYQGRSSQAVIGLFPEGAYCKSLWPWSGCRAYIKDSGFNPAVSYGFIRLKYSWKRCLKKRGVRSVSLRELTFTGRFFINRHRQYLCKKSKERR